MTTTPAIYIEIEGAPSHPSCKVGGPFIAMPILDPRPYSDPSAPAALARTVDAAISYARTRVVGGIDQPPLVVRIDAGITFADVGRRDAGSGASAALMGPTATEAVKGYETGCLDYRKKTNLPGHGWVGSEFENVCAIIDRLSAAKLNTVVYLDSLGEMTLSLWGQGARPEIDQAISSIAASPRARRRGFPSSTNPRTDAAKFDSRARDVTSTTAERMLADAGFYGWFIVAGAGNAGDACPDESLIAVPGGSSGTTLFDQQFSHFGWYPREGVDPQMVTAACVHALSVHRRHSVDYWPQFSIQTTPADLKARLRYGAGDRATVWGDPADLSKLTDLAAAVAAWSN